MPPPETGQNSTRGIILMVLAMAAFAIADTFIKLSAGSISPAQTMLLLMSGGLVLFALIATVQGAPLLDRRAVKPVLLVRYVAEIVGVACMVMALTLVPLSTVGAILQASPLVVTMGAVLFLGERVSWRRWTAITVGFFGVLLIIQPGGEAFDTNVLWAVASMAGLSARDLMTRLTPPDMASSSLAAFTMIASIPFALAWVMMSGQDVVPTHANWWFVAGMVGVGSMGYLLLMASIRMAEVSVVSPYRYSRLIFLLGLGVVLFGEQPGLSILGGAALIILSGIYIMWRERQLKRTTV